MQQAQHCTPNLIDARGMACPMPLLKAKQALAAVAEGEQVRVLASDPGSVKDIQRFIELSAHQLIEFRESESYYEYLLQRGKSTP